MILNRLTVVNFGVYRGRHDFNLRPQNSGSIVLLGGKNGAGKTTLLNAIRLCLHGPQALNEWTSRSIKQSDYEKYLRERIHRNSNGVVPLDWASLELEFEYAIAGERQNYIIERSWKDTGQRIEESLHVFQDGQRLDDMGSEQWGDFIRDLIPMGLARLFFFDSEKIQSLANGSSDIHRITLSQVIKSLLGLNTVEQLQADLGVYRRRQQKDNQIDSVEQKIEDLENRLEQIGAEEQRLLAQVDILNAQMETVETKIKTQESKLARAGAGFARQREEYKENRIRLEVQIEEVQQAIRELCSGLLPFAIAPVHTTAVQEQLLREADYQQWQASKTLIEQRLDQVQYEIESPLFWLGTGAEALEDFQHVVAKRVAQTLQNVLEPPPTVRDTVLRHHASEPEQRQILQWIESSRTLVPEQIEQLTNRLSRLYKERDETELALQRVPADDVLGPLVEALNKYNQDLGELVQKRRREEEDLRRLELQREEIQRNLRQARAATEAREKMAEKIRRVIDVQLVLDDFQSELLRLRVSQLEETFTRNFNLLCRKDRLLETTRIDPSDFSVTLIGTAGEAISQSELSAGEQQIYAIAVLWALRQVSGRPLPVVIDAPLGRLDSEHRQNLVERYFPHASHQVILFSTDTEVDAQFYAAMEDNVSHAYHLVYDQERQASQASEGYFWQSYRGKVT